MIQSALMCGIGLALGLLFPVSASAIEVELAGVFGKKAVLVVDGGTPKTIGVGERTREGVRLVEVVGNSAVIEVDGRSRRIDLGAGAVRLGSNKEAAHSINLIADSRGHFFGGGNVNGAPVRFLVDTGASMVSIGASDARRAGIDYRSGQQGRAQTASGPTTVWHVTLDSVKVGDLTLRGVDALIHENDLPFALLGMSFLNRMDMQREGDRLILRKRY